MFALQALVIGVSIWCTYSLALENNQGSWVPGKIKYKLMNKLEQRKNIFKSRTGSELSEKLIAYMKKYTIPEMKQSEKNLATSYKMSSVQEDYGALFDGKLPANTP